MRNPVTISRYEDKIIDLVELYQEGKITHTDMQGRATVIVNEIMDAAENGGK